MLTPAQLVLLTIMYELDQDEYRLWYYSDIEQHLRWAGNIMLPTEVRKVMKSLRKLGFVTWGHGQGEDDNFIYGSGHYISKQGKAYLLEYTPNPT